MTKMLKDDYLPKGCWRYALVKRVNKETGEVFYNVGEVFPSGEFFGWPDHNLPGYSIKEDIYGESPEEVLKTLKMMIADIEDCIEKDIAVDDEHCSTLPVEEIDWDEIEKNSIESEELFAELEEEFKLGDKKE